MHPRVQGLDPAVDHLGKAGDIRNADDRQAGGRQGPRGPPGRHQVHPRAARAEAKGTNPVLSETLSSARMNTLCLPGSPGAVRASPQLQLDNVPPPH